MKRERAGLLVAFFLGFSLVLVGNGGAEERKGTFVVPTHPRITFRKDDLAKLRKKCLTTHAREYAMLKSSSDAAAFLEDKPVAPGLLFQLTNESRFLRYAEGDYDAFHEVLDPEKAKALANDILYRNRRQTSVTGRVHTTDGYWLPRLLPWTDVLRVLGDDVPLAKPGELETRLNTAVRRFRASRQIHNAVAYRRGGKATSFHCACFFQSGAGSDFIERWRVATGENYFGDLLMAGFILQPMHNTLPLEHHCAPMTNIWGHNHIGRPADYIIASRVRDGLCQWVLHNPAWVTARDVGKHDPADFNALGHAWVDGTRELGGYKEASWTQPVAWWPGHMPERILYYDPSVREVPPNTLPTSALFEGLGMVCARNSWKDDAVFARLHSGPTFRGEPPHLNDNTFILYHKGWLVRSETSKGVLTSDASSILVKDPDEKIMITTGGLWPDEVWDGKLTHIKESKINDGGQSYWKADIGKMNIKCRGKITAYEASEHFTYAVGDATESYNPAKLESFTRQFLYLKPGLVIIFDRVKSTKPEFEKRWVVHTLGKPTPTADSNVFMADAFSTVKPQLSPGWDRTVGFAVPVLEDGPPQKCTLKFKTQWDGVEVGLVHKTGPDFGKVKWTFDAGRKTGEINQRSEEEKTLVESALVSDIPKGEHTLELVSPDGRMNYSFFTVKMGGRLFVTTLLPEKSKKEVTGNKTTETNIYSRGCDWRTDVIATEPGTDDVFLHVLEATDRRQKKPVRVRRTNVANRVVLRFEYHGKRYEVTFNRTGDVGGRIKVGNGRGKGPVDKGLAAGIVDADDAHIENCRRLMKDNRHYDYEVREIAHLTPKADSRELIDALGDKRWYVRFYAVRALEVKREKAAAAKFAQLLRDRDARVAAIAAEALGRLGAKQAVPGLLKALASDEDEVRLYSAWALGELKAKTAVPALVRLLPDENDFVSASAAEALGKIRDEKAAQALAAAIDAHDETHMKTSYLWALASIGGDIARKRLEAFKSSEDRTLRACALAGLVKLSGKDASPVLRKALKDEDRGIQAFARRKLKALGEATDFKVLVQRAKDENAEFATRAASLKALGELGHKEAADEIALLLEDQKPYPRPHRHDSISAHAALALYRLGDQRGVKFLAEALGKGADTSKRHVARGAAAALRQVEKKLAVPILISGLDVRRTQAAGGIVKSLFKVTGEDPGADIEVVGWRRAGLDVQRWKEWWVKNKADYQN